ncbi:autoinducer-binding transcriptional regulator, LuxR family protein [Pseudooceanicola batsensis HTCC2597]|uniref:Autoinducer-binding transcriptional regulator, LuxR family protein n=1 Tax=Pseudooceanicola batsensis (strain ATCC BAA-863 / DSM 15984 / KCTC 12145 / HTCC2597) TaxID=252305 RepID=A3TXQ4_PSEBH|nr:autoinducer binding domain-containing protein [Pseudooceanicola batsensis]EAQ03614.1 autoinducer-binding transcriptional regulator, LuxR family protein [Pseudooceanicola batsensis HTCC2597]
MNDTPRPEILDLSEPERLASRRDYLERLTNAQTIEELWRLHCDKMAGYGFDRLIYGFTRYRTATSLGDPEDFVILTNHTEAYTEGFLGKGLYFHAPMVRWALEHEGACSWGILEDMIASGTLTGSERKVIEFNRQHDVLTGYSISFKSISPRTKGAIALTARSGLSQAEVDGVWQQHGRDIVVMNNVAHLKILTLPYAGPARGLTKRQREALQWVGDGKTTADIALLMGLTSATVEKHLRLAREALNVETTAQAVLKAAFLNQMFVLEA